MTTLPIADSSEHQQVSELLPWYVNETLSQAQRMRVEAHLESCAACCADLEVERRLHAALSDDATIEYVPTGSLKRLMSKIDAAADGVTPALAPSPLPRPLRRQRLQGLMAASIVALAVLVGVLAADRWQQAHARAGVFHTVTSPAPRPAEETVRAVFTPTVTLTELQAVLDEADLRIVAGPSEAGVYSLATTSQRPIAESLALLRRHSSVRFAESTR